MSKKTNTILFILGATVFNVLTIFIIYFVCIFISAYLFNESIMEYAGIAQIIIFIISITGGFALYRLLMKIICRKIDMDKYFEPIISRNKK